mgnify:CR=1 FL=1
MTGKKVERIRYFSDKLRCFSDCPVTMQLSIGKADIPKGFSTRREVNPTSSISL